mmetsp:Transcript_37637/g.69626  ORF Transcript_37637/g.69626 Transcript_37637/m.69626 type:complete len:86 (-) Transcript_37637:114-371(-)
MFKGVGATGGGGGGAAAVVSAGAATLGALTAAAIGAARLAAQPSFPRNLIDGLLASFTAVDNMVCKVEGTIIIHSSRGRSIYLDK